MTHKLVAFSDSQQSLYMQNQLDAIKNIHPSLEIELANENDSRLKRHLKIRHRGRVPVLMIFNNGIFKNYKLGKLILKDALAWVEKQNIE